MNHKIQILIKRFLYDLYGKRKFGDKIQNEIDDEVVKILHDQMEIAKNILIEKKELVEIMVERLLEKKTLMFRDIYEILGDRPFEPPTNFKRFLEEFHRSMRENEQENEEEIKEEEVNNDFDNEEEIKPKNDYLEN